ncbi:flagellar protein FlaG [Rhodocyclaceae bacterium SMB388]
MSIPSTTSSLVSAAGAALRGSDGPAARPAPARAGDAASVSRAAAPAGSPPAASQADIRQAVDEVRNAISPVAQNLLFSIDEDTNKTVIKIIDSSTDEVIRQIPSEEFLAMSRALDKLQGLLIRQEA